MSSLDNAEIIDIPKDYKTNNIFILNKCLKLKDFPWYPRKTKTNIFEESIDFWLNKQNPQANSTYIIEDNLGIAEFYNFGNIIKFDDESDSENKKTSILLLINKPKFPDFSKKNKFRLKKLTNFGDKNSNLYGERVEEKFVFDKTDNNIIEVEEPNKLLRYNGNNCAKEYIGNNNIVNITIDPDPPQFKFTNNTLYSENNKSVEGNTNDTCLTKYYTLLPENKIKEEMYVGTPVSGKELIPRIFGLSINEDNSILNIKSFEDNGWIKNVLSTDYLTKNYSHNNIFRLVYILGVSQSNYFYKKILETNVFINKTLKKICISENGPDNINWVNCENMNPFPPNPNPNPNPNPSSTNSNNSKDEVNLPLIIGVSVGGFVLLAVIVYYFMGKGRRSRRSKKVSNNKMNANRRGAKKAGRGRSK